MKGLSGWLLRRWYSRYPVWSLIPLAVLFALLAALRRGAYRLGVLKAVSLPVPVLVAGNVTVGGTGKTPFVVWLSEALQKRGWRPGIVTGGYGGQGSQRPQFVDSRSDPQEVGDEPVLLAGRCGVPVMAAKDRAAAAQLLIEKYSVDVVISDDGLQHYRLPRDFEVALLDAERGLGNGWQLPAGPLREPVRRLDDVDLVILKQSGTHGYSRPGAVEMSLTLGDAVNLVDGSRRPLKQFAGQSVHAVAAIGHPEQFFGMLEATGLRVIPHPLPDHAQPRGAELQYDDTLPVFMTEKDAVKCRQLNLPQLWYVPATARFSTADEARILDLVQAALDRHGCSRNS